MKKLKYLYLGLLVVSTMLNAQNKEIEQADTSFNNLAYAPAINSYEDLVEQGYSQEQIVKNLGNANYLNANYKEAAKWYEKLFELENTELRADYMFRYAQTLKSLEKYTEADSWMQKFNNSKGSDSRGVLYKENLDYLEKIESNSYRYTIKNLDINSSESDFAPSFQNEMLVFSTARDTGLIAKNIHLWNNKNFLNLYNASPNQEGEYKQTKKLSNKLNRKTHESSTAFTQDGKTVYFTRNNSKNGKFVRDKGGVSRLKIYKATLKKRRWTKVTELPFNGEDYSVAHPTLNADETKLYFASDMPGTLGESDIFVVDINTDGSYGVPKNLGPKINTEGKETFPFITPSNKLYFASDGHPGLGGLDVFVCNLENKYKPTVENIGKPINSVEDDFSFIFNEDLEKGFFASNRKGGHGSDDIYSFIETKTLNLECKTIISGIVKDAQTGEILSNADMTFLDQKNNILATTTSMPDGTFKINSTCENIAYEINTTKETYLKNNSSFSTVTGEDTTDIIVNLEKEKQPAPFGTDLAKYLDIEPIYFDFDKSNIRKDAQISMEKVLTYLREFPLAKIQVRSHTDSRGNDIYNEALSSRRANATAKYLISQGIDENRISYKGYGETQLTNPCVNDVPCSKEKHQSNRRSEFIVME